MLTDLLNQIPYPDLRDGLRLLIALAAGLFASMAVGGVVVDRFYRHHLDRLDGAWGEKTDPYNDFKTIDPRTVGNVERLVFSLAAAVAPIAAVAAMGGWLVLKMSTHWNKPLLAQDAGEHRKHKSYAMLGLVTGLLSMGFAGAGGFIIHQLLELDMH